MSFTKEQLAWMPRKTLLQVGKNIRIETMTANGVKFLEGRCIGMRLSGSTIKNEVTGKEVSGVQFLLLQSNGKAKWTTTFAAGHEAKDPDSSDFLKVKHLVDSARRLKKSHVLLTQRQVSCLCKDSVESMGCELKTLNGRKVLVL